MTLRAGTGIERRLCTRARDSRGWDVRRFAWWLSGFGVATLFWRWAAGGGLDWLGFALTAFVTLGAALDVWSSPGKRGGATNDAGRGERTNG